MTTAETQQDEATVARAVGALLDCRVGRLPPLKDYTDAELLAEVARRRKERERTKPTKWCDECVHFAGGIGDGKVLANPCSKDHQMLFLMPDSATDVEWGYYKRWCHDRREKLNEDA